MYIENDETGELTYTIDTCVMLIKSINFSNGHSNENFHLTYIIMM